MAMLYQSMSRAPHLADPPSVFVNGLRYRFEDECVEGEPRLPPIPTFEDIRASQLVRMAEEPWLELSGQYKRSKERESVLSTAPPVLLYSDSPTASNESSDNSPIDAFTLPTGGPTSSQSIDPVSTSQTQAVTDVAARPARTIHSLLLLNDDERRMSGHPLPLQFPALRRSSLQQQAHRQALEEPSPPPSRLSTISDNSFTEGPDHVPAIAPSMTMNVSSDLLQDIGSGFARPLASKDSRADLLDPIADDKQRFSKWFSVNIPEGDEPVEPDVEISAVPVYESADTSLKSSGGWRKRFGSLNRGDSSKRSLPSQLRNRSVASVVSGRGRNSHGSSVYTDFEESFSGSVDEVCGAPLRLRSSTITSDSNTPRERPSMNSITSTSSSISTSRFPTAPTTPPRPSNYIRQLRLKQSASRSFEFPPARPFPFDEAAAPHQQDDTRSSESLPSLQVSHEGFHRSTESLKYLRRDLVMGLQHSASVRKARQLSVGFAGTAGDVPAATQGLDADLSYLRPASHERAQVRKSQVGLAL